MVRRAPGCYLAALGGLSVCACALVRLCVGLLRCITAVPLTELILPTLEHWRNLRLLWAL
jgi:hypothetical protein